MPAPRQPHPTTPTTGSPPSRRRLVGRALATVGAVSVLSLSTTVSDVGVVLAETAPRSIADSGGIEARSTTGDSAAITTTALDHPALDRAANGDSAGIVTTALDHPALDRARITRAGRITTRGEEREELIPAPIVLRDNDVLPVGQLRVEEDGVAGLRHEIVEVILHDGIAVDERVVASTVRPPTPMIVSVGTSASEAAARDWEALARCESGGDPTIVSRSGRYHGLYQFDRRTWESVGGTGLPSEASPDEQRRRAILLYEQRGAQPWPTCGRHL